MINGNGSVLIAVFLLFLSGLLTNTATLKICPNLEGSSNCSCSSDNSSFEVICQRNGERISIAFIPYHYRIASLQRVQINCHGMQLGTFDYNTLPAINLSGSLHIHVQNCPLSSGESRGSLFQKIRVFTDNKMVIDSTGGIRRADFEGFGDLKYLDLISSNLSNLPEDAFNELRTLHTLNLVSNTLELKIKIFSSLQNLHILTLSRNILSNLAPGIFHNQKSLEYLSLNNNNLSELIKASFEGCSSVTNLDLEFNKLTHFPSDVFSLMTNLRNIHLRGNYIQFLPDDLFAANKQLYSFSLDKAYVPLKHLPARLFANLPRLNHVRLSCGLEAIPEYIFANSTSIDFINLSNNSLQELPSELFANQYHITRVDLSQNRLMALPDGLFSRANYLETLFLSHNQLVSISNETLAGLRSLRDLRVSNNNVHTIHMHAFESTKKLESVNLENNQLESTHSSNTSSASVLTLFTHLRHLQILNLRNNSIRSLHKNGFKQLVRVDLSYNNLTRITRGELETTPCNAFVNLSHNFIHTIDFTESYPENEFCPFKKIWFDVSYNPIDCDCKLLAFVRHQETVKEKKCFRLDKTTSASGAKCSHPMNLRGQAIGNLSLTELVCPFKRGSTGKNLCPDSCSCWVRPGDGTAIVNCSNAQLTEMSIIPNLTEISNLYRMEMFHGIALFIENNRLTELSNANTTGYMHVVEVHASNNSLSEVLTTNLPRNLKFMNLSENKIQRLDEAVLRVITKNRVTLALAGNPWICDCTAQGLLNYVHYNNKLIHDSNELKCMDGRRVLDHTPSAFCYKTENFIIAGCVLIAVVALCVAFFYRHQQEIKIWLYAHGMCLWFVSEDDLDGDKEYDAFVSYSHKDEDFVSECLLPGLESGPTPFKICIHVRDWIVGEFIPNQITRSVADSRRTIIVLSTNFIESVWGRLEFRAAHTAALNEGRARVIVVIYNDVGNIDSLDSELKAYLQMNTYVKWGDPWFWKKLRYAMPHATRNLSNNELELLEPSQRTSPAETESVSRSNV